MKYIDRVLRYAILAIGALAEVLFVAVTFHYFRTQYVWIEVILRLLGFIICVSIANNSRHLSVNLIWILLIALFPVPGTLIFLLLGADLIRSKTARALFEADEKLKERLVQDEEIFREITEKAPDLKGDHYYLAGTAGYPIYRNTGFDYYGLGEMGYPEMLEEMERAERYIFLEYFIIEDGVMWERMHEILKRKAEAGLDVRVMYDDFGSMKTLDVFYSHRLEREGIRCLRFNKINPVLGSVMNHRDHRKILVIDGKVAFSGGINLADEYINRRKRFGHWKDNCVKIRGEAVRTLALIFLTTWNSLRKTDDSYEQFFPDQEEAAGEPDGYIAPYAGTPFSTQPYVGQNVYINMINSATDYLYICTPYLLIDTDLENALILAAQKGVDVVIMTPGIPDKKLVWWITRSYYHNLTEAGVRIYEYTPGFVHAKTFVSDDRAATIGTFNLDYRSLYLHLENGIYLCGSKAITEIRDDFRKTLEVSHRVGPEDIRNGLFRRVLIGIAKLFVSQL